LNENNDIQYESFDSLKNNKAFDVIYENFQTDIVGKKLKFGDTIMGTVSLKCSRCIGNDGKRKPFSESYPIYIAILLLWKSNIISCPCIPVEPILRKSMKNIDFDNISYPHLEEVVNLKFTNRIFKKEEIFHQKIEINLPIITCFAPEYCTVGDYPKIIFVGKGFQSIQPPYIYFADIGYLQNPSLLDDNKICGYVPICRQRKAVSLMFLYSNQYYSFGYFNYKFPDDKLFQFIGPLEDNNINYNNQKVGQDINYTNYNSQEYSNNYYT